MRHANTKSGKPRRGATLIELLVALLLLNLALLTLAAMSAVVARHVGDAGRRNRSAIAASSRLEQLTSRPCGAMTAGAGPLEPGVTETWSITPLRGAVEIVDSVSMDSHTKETLVLRSRVTC